MQTSLSTTTPITHAAATSSREGGTGLKVINGLCAVVHAGTAGARVGRQCASAPNQTAGLAPILAGLCTPRPAAMHQLSASSSGGITNDSSTRVASLEL